MEFSQSFGVSGPAPKQEQPPHAIRVLLLDDEEDAYYVARSFLGKVDPAGYVVTWISDAEQAPAALASGDHDVCLLDLHLGRHNGLELLAAARREAWPTPILLLTSERDRNRDLEAMQLGAVGYLEKSDLDARSLDRALRYALRQCNDLNAVRQEVDRYASALRGAGEGIWIWDVTSDELTLSPGLADWLGHSSTQKEGLESWIERIVAEDRDGFRRALSDHRENQSERFRCEYRVRDEDGSVRWMLARGDAVRDEEGKAIRVTGSQSDITELKEIEFRLRREALIDPLTGLANRNALLERVSNALTRRRRHRDFRFALLFLDLDHFKAVNDTLGHAAGDKLLRAVAQRLGRCLRANDTAGRFGGDEFAVLLDDIANEHDAVRVARRIQRDLSRPFELEGHRTLVTVSIGIAHANGDHVGPEELLRDADAALYRAKRNGRARCEIFDLELHASAMESLRLEGELRRAVQDRDFSIVYQPIVELRTKRPVALEGFVRWSTSARPGACFQIIEDSGLSILLARGTLDLACSHIRQWQERDGKHPRLPVFLNFSSRQLQHPNPAEVVAQVLAAHDLDPTDLGIGVDERVLSESEACHALADLRRLGVRVVVDDYGRGSSSLAALPRLPVDGLKIDPLLTDPSSTDTDWSIAGVIVSLADQLGFIAIAEAVETEEQRERLLALGCPWGQGRALGSQLDPDRVPEWLRKHSPIQ